LKDVVYEGEGGYHNELVVAGFRLGFFLFIFTEFMFFVGIFWFFFDNFWFNSEY